MKTKRTNKLLVLVISLMMIVTLLAGLSITANAEETGTETNTPVAEFVGQQVNLGGDISMKFYVRNNEDRPIESITVEVEFLGKLTYITECEKHPTDAKVYIYTFEGINPQCLGDLMNVTILWGGIPVGHEKAMLTGYSVEKNLNEIYDDCTEAQKQLIDDLRAYGKASEVYTGHTSMTGTNYPVREVAIPATSITTTDTADDVNLHAVNVRFGTMNYLMFKFEFASGTPTDIGDKVKIDGEAPADAYIDGNYYVVISKPISPENFHKDVSLVYDESKLTLSYSINDYCRTVVDGEYTEEMKSLAKALYNYGLSAHIVEGNHEGGEATCTHGKLCDICGFEYDTTQNPDNHASENYTYTDNGDGTHTKTHECGVIVGEPENHTIENHVCTACGAMEITVSFDAGNYEWKTGDQICLLREAEFIDDCAFTATVAEDGTVTWTADKPFCWYGEGDQKLFAAPNNGWSIDYFVIPEDQSTAAKLDEADLINGMWVGTPTTDTITFNMTHRMAKVTVNYEFAEGVTADISELKVYSIAQICRFSIDDWSIKLTSAGQADVWVTPYLDDNQFTAFIIPETYATGEDFIKITLSDGTVYEVKMNKAVTFAEGAEYTYKVLITADGAYLTCADECTFEYTDNEDGLTHSKVCTECGYVAASENHTLTYTANGHIITESCSAGCGYSETATISATDATYNGLEHNTATVDYSDGWKGGELTVSYANNTNAGTATASITVGEATATVDFTIAKAPLTVTANDASITYGEAPTHNGVTYSGFVNGENETVLSGELVYTYTYTQYGDVGEYSITPQGLTADNYEITFVDGTLTVNAKEVTEPIVTLDQTSYQYDGNVKEPKVISIVVDGRTLIEGTDYTVSYEDNVYVGNYATVVINFMGNYDGTFRKWFTITQDPDTTEFDGEWVTVNTTP